VPVTLQTVGDCVANVTASPDEADALRVKGGPFSLRSAMKGKSIDCAAVVPVEDVNDADTPPMVSVVTTLPPAAAEAVCRRQMTWPVEITPGVVMNGSTQPIE